MIGLTSEWSFYMRTYYILTKILDSTKAKIFCMNCVHCPRWPCKIHHGRSCYLIIVAKPLLFIMFQHHWSTFHSCPFLVYSELVAFQWYTWCQCISNMASNIRCKMLNRILFWAFLILFHFSNAAIGPHTIC